MKNIFFYCYYDIYLSKMSLSLKELIETNFSQPNMIIWSPPKDGLCLLHCVVILYHILRMMKIEEFDNAFNGVGSLFKTMPLRLSDIKNIVNISEIEESLEISEECKKEISRLKEENIVDLDNVILEVFNLIASLITGEETWLEKRIECFKGHFYLVLSETNDMDIFNSFIKDKLHILHEMNKKSDELKTILEENLKLYSTVLNIQSFEEYQKILNCYTIRDSLNTVKNTRCLNEYENVKLDSLNSFLEDKASRNDIENILKTL